MGNLTNRFNNELKKKHEGYERQMFQTFLTAPEWRNVEMAEEFGRFLQQGNAFYQFPFFKQVGTFWRVFAKSYGVAKQHHSHTTLLTSEYMLMNAFIGMFTTVGFVGLGLLSSGLALVLKRKNESYLQQHVGFLVTDYANFIHKIPFYHYDYKGKIKPLYEAFKQTKNKSLTDYVTFATAICQLMARGIVSKPIAWWYSKPQNVAADRIHILVKSTHDKAALEKIDSEIKVLEVQEKVKKNVKSHYAHMTVPRYEAFATVVEKLISHDVAIRKIAGQESIQCKVVCEAKSLSELPQDHVLYSYQNHVDEQRFVMLNMKANDLNQIVHPKDNGFKLKLMHDF